MIFIPVLGSSTKKVDVVLDKEGQEEKLLVVFAGKGDDVIDLDLSAVHKSVSTQGRIVVRGVLLDSAFAKVKGLIKIEKDAQKSEDFLEEKALLVGKDSKVETYPYLEIEADDVRASHGATVGVVDEEQLFYLRSRGISRSTAVELVVGGFLGGILDDLGNVAPRKEKQLLSKLEEIKSYVLD